MRPNLAVYSKQTTWTKQIVNSKQTANSYQTVWNNKQLVANKQFGAYHTQIVCYLCNNWRLVLAHWTRILSSCLFGICCLIFSNLAFPHWTCILFGVCCLQTVICQQSW